MHTTHLRKVGGSIMLAVPTALLDILQLRPGVKVGITVEGGCLVVKPGQRPRYTLGELIGQCDPKAPQPRKDRQWLDSPRSGQEII
jgi:antitoxin ChpS